tara:strand:+ start:658 stop:1320 length:663 start_codon:yes stop_codon:yes gene_type:complete
MKSEIINILKTKSKIKQLVYSNTKTFFENLKEKLIQTEKHLIDRVTSSNNEIEIKYLSSGNFEAMLQFSDETLLFNMHSNVFDLPKNHSFKNSDYLKNDLDRSFCGLINIYNFLSDSYKYKRLNDEVYLIGRIFINKDNNFFVEGEKPIGFLFRDFPNQNVKPDLIEKILSSCILYCLNDDLIVPDFNDYKIINVHHILQTSNNQKLKTAKKLGYRLSDE